MSAWQRCGTTPGSIPENRGDWVSTGIYHTQLKAHKITQKAFAEGIGMSPRHLRTIKSAEARNHFFHELGATKLAVLWVVEHIGKGK